MRLCAHAGSPACAALHTNKTIMGFPSQGSRAGGPCLSGEGGWGQKGHPVFQIGHLPGAYGHARLISHAMANIVPRCQQSKTIQDVKQLSSITYSCLGSKSYRSIYQMSDWLAWLSSNWWSLSIEIWMNNQEPVLLLFQQDQTSAVMQIMIDPCP